MCWMHYVSASLLLFPLMFYALIAMATMLAFYNIRQVVREVIKLIPTTKPIVRDKFDEMTFTQWWTEKRRRTRTNVHRGASLRYYIRNARNRGSRIGIKKAKYVIEIDEPVAYAAANDHSSEDDKEDRNRIQQIKFDTDSYPIGVDTFSSRCVTNNIDHFETCAPSISKNRRKIKVADGGRMDIKGTGTVTWKLEDDDGVVHKIRIKNTLYVPNLDHCLLSPQHVAQALEKDPETTHATQCGNKCILTMP